MSILAREFITDMDLEEVMAVADKNEFDLCLYFEITPSISIHIHPAQVFGESFSD